MAEFGAAISIGSKEAMDSDEVECLVANMIYKVRSSGFINDSFGRMPSSVTPYRQFAISIGHAAVQ